MIDAPAVIRLLLDSQVDFVVIGGVAMSVHGSRHVTFDLDLCYRRTVTNFAALAAAFAPIHPGLRCVPPALSFRFDVPTFQAWVTFLSNSMKKLSPFRFDVPTLQTSLNFFLVTDHGDVDLLGKVHGVGTYNNALVQSEEQERFGLKFRVLSLDGLIAAKRAAGRLKDRNHLLELEALQKRRAANQQGA